MPPCMVDVGNRARWTLSGIVAAVFVTLVGCTQPAEVIQTVIVEKEVQVEVEVVKEVEVPQTVIVEKEVSVPETVVVEKEVLVEVVKEVPVPQTVIVEREVEVAGETVEVEKVVEVEKIVEVEKTVEVERVVTAQPGTVTPTPTSVPTATPVPPTPTPDPQVPPTPTPSPLQEIEFAGVVTSTNLPSQVQIVFALRDQDGHSVVLPADQVQRGISVYEQGPGTDGWEEIDYSETSFFVHTAENIDLEVVFVLDFTNSMYEARLPDGRTGVDAMLDAFNAAVAVLPSAHRIGVVEFHDRNVEPSVLSPLTTDRNSIRSSVARFANSGFDHCSSRVWDGVAVGSELFSSVDANPRAVRALVFLSDGRDTSSVATRDSLEGIASERKAQLYALGVGDVFQSSELRSLASDTGGAYYSARDVSRLQTQLQLLVNDLQGQYQLTYITLRRTGQYRSGLTFNYRGLEASMGTDRFDVASFFGPDNQGVISHDPPALDRSNGTADVFVRALHIPRNIDRIRFNPGTAKPVSVELVAESDGGLIDGWTLSGPDGSGYYEVSSTDAIEFGNSGLLFKLTYSNIVEKGLALPLHFDSSIYSSGKQLTYAGQIHVGERPRIAFVSDRDGDNEIYVMDADGTGVVQLTDNSVDDWSPRWSPDGNRIAYTSGSWPDYDTYVANADGTGVVRLTNNSGYSSFRGWSPDGSRIAYHLDRNGGEYNAEDMDIYVANADGTGAVRVTDNSGYNSFSRWSPDGSRIAYISDRDGGEYNSEDTEIYVMNADGSGIVQLTDNSGYDSFGGWSPDGSRIAYTSDRNGGEYNREDMDIYISNADGSSVVRLTDNSHYDSFARWSRDGRRVAFHSDRDGGAYDDQDVEIYVMNADGTGTVRMTDNSRYDSFVDWSQDGNRIAYRSDRNGGEYNSEDTDIYVANADGTGVVRLTNNSGYNSYPRWSPDGSRIAFCSDRNGGEYNWREDADIYIANADGTGVVRLTNNSGYNSCPSWAPDGSRIAYVTDFNGGGYNSEDHEIYIANADGTGVVRLTNNSAEDSRPSWSP